jgi:hypothetical protein
VPRYRLDLKSVLHAAEIGQVVEGRWKVASGESGVPCLQIDKDDAGYDRVILFGSRDWADGYEIRATLEVTDWTGESDHGVGVLFKWNPHLQGDGTRLPTPWSSGIGFYYFPADARRFLLGFPGARPQVRVGKDVRRDVDGNWMGQHVVKQGLTSMGARALSEALRLAVLTRPLPPVPRRRRCHFRVTVSKNHYSLAIWPESRSEPPPQVALRRPKCELPCGSVGIVAHHCALRLYRFEVSGLETEDREAYRS